MGARRNPPPISTVPPKQGQTHQPTKQTRAKVSLWAQVGTPRHVIAHEIGVSEGTLRKAYFYELEEADAKGVANVAATLYAKALAGDTSAAVAFLKAKGKKEGWGEKDVTVNIELDAGRDLVAGITAAMSAAKLAHPSTFERVIEGSARVIDVVPTEDGSELL